MAEAGRVAVSATQRGLPLSARERRAVQAFLQRLHRDHGQLVQQTTLFGSKARGDSGPESDIDLLILVEDENWTLRDAISVIAARVSLEYDVLISPRVIGRERWQHMERERFSFCEHIAQDGVPLTAVRA
jgi:predicted nucleotidyltransferase